MSPETVQTVPADILGQAARAAASAAGRGAKSAPQDPENRARVAAAAEEFEAVFLSQMLQPMFEALETDGPFGGGSGERAYRALMVQEYGRVLARAGGVGIADAVEREILKLQEIQQ